MTSSVRRLAMVKLHTALSLMRVEEHEKTLPTPQNLGNQQYFFRDS